MKKFSFLLIIISIACKNENISNRKSCIADISFFNNSMVCNPALLNIECNLDDSLFQEFHLRNIDSIKLNILQPNSFPKNLGSLVLHLNINDKEKKVLVSFNVSDEYDFLNKKEYDSISNLIEKSDVVISLYGKQRRIWDLRMCKDSIKKMYPN